LRLDEYNYQGQEDGTEKNTMSLIKGGFRTITGVVGKKNKKNYKVNTPVATIGIRGTHYGLHYCGSDCGVNTGDGKFQNKEGLYGGVVDGAVVANNDSGEIRLGNDEYFHVASKTSEPQVLLVPPSIIFKASDTTGGNANDGSDPVKEESPIVTNGDTDYLLPPPDEQVAGLPPPPNDPPLPTPVPKEEGPAGTTKLETGVLGIAFIDGPPANSVSGMLNTNYDVIYVNNAGEPAYIKHVDQNFDPANEPTNATKCDPCEIYVTGTNASNQGSNNALGVSWGRWNAADYKITQNGTPITPVTSLSYIYSNNVTSSVRLADLHEKHTTATYSVSNIIGSDANLTDIGSATLDVSANFLTQKFTGVNYSISATDTWVGYIDPSVGEVAFTDNFIPLKGTCDGACTDNTTGKLNATFVGNDAEGMMTTFNINADTSNESISGAALLTKNP